MLINFFLIKQMFFEKLKTYVETCFSYNIIFVNSSVSFYKEKKVAEHLFK